MNSSDGRDPATVPVANDDVNNEVTRIGEEYGLSDNEIRDVQRRVHDSKVPGEPDRNWSKIYSDIWRALPDRVKGQ